MPSRSGEGPAGAEREPGREPAGQQELVLAAESLFKGTREIVITHRGERYRLRITQNEKLILTK